MSSAADLFLGLTPEAVLAAIEAAGLRCTSLCWPLNSYENRVMEIELADAARTRLVTKFYRPQRWSEAQILEEHAFLAQLQEQEVPVVAALPFPDGGTLRQVAVAGGAEVVWFCLFPRFGGRAPEEVSDALAARLGALCARIHVVGARQPFVARERLDGTSYATTALDVLQASGHVPVALRRAFFHSAQAVISQADAWLRDAPVQRIHGDFHLGNLIYRDNLLYALDFDDARSGPPIQDLWMLLPGRDPDSVRRRELFIQSYEQFRPFDRSTLRLIEPLRGLRLVHFCGWLAARWHDPIFPQTWPQFATDTFWQEAIGSLQEAMERAWDEPAAPAVLTEAEDAELSNADFFWDWDK